MASSSDARPLARLRLRLTAWYGATFGLILLLLGTGLFLVIRAQIARRLDVSLRQATRELEGAAAIREVEATSAHGLVVDAVDELHIPDRALYLLETDGRPVKPAQAADWIRAAARSAGSGPAVDLDRNEPDGRELRLHAERFTLAGGRAYVGAAVADRGELEDEYAALIGAFGAAAALALLLVAAGGYLLVHQSVAPVERSMVTMRRFMADAAHELRTPLAVLRSRAEVTLQQGRESAGYVEALRSVEAEATRLGGIVDELLTLARADSGERPLQRERLFLDDAVLDAAGAARAVAERSGVTLDLDALEEAPVQADPVLLRQLLMIVLDNAIKFTPAGGRVRVGVSAAGGQPSVMVQDTGVGIPADQLPHVFERFYRGDAARGRADGAGLGLSIARWIADAHGAAIAIASEPVQGTSVTLRFPAVAPAP